MALARRHCRMLGGAMRQNGIYSAAALHALDQHRDRLAEDHVHARQLALMLAASPAVQLDLATVQTNIVVFRLAPGGPDAATLVAAARERGVLLNAFASRTVRAVTHLDVSATQVTHAGEILLELLAMPGETGI
jgi:threonine aldolase